MTKLRVSVGRALLAAMFLLSISVLIPVHADEALAEVKAPNVDVVHVGNDDRLQLSDYAGQVVLLNFWASWCYPCLVEMPEFQKIHDEFKDQGFSVLAVAVFDKLPDARAFQQSQQFTFPLLFDDTEQATDAFEVEVVPQTFLIGRDGMLVPIPNPKTQKSKLWVNDPTIWVQPQTYEFLAALVAK